MKYRTTDHPVEDAARFAAMRLQERLKRGEQVLWLLSGGSSMRIAVLAMAALDDADTERLAITVTDERYGPVGHPDENWQQLLAMGFRPKRAEVYRPLIGQSADDTTAQFASWLQAHLSSADYVIGIFGIGTDGHTTGLKPGSSALRSDEYAAHFEGDDFWRITMTFRAIRQTDEAILQASGADKVPVLRSVFGGSQSPMEQPAQIIKSIPSVTLFTDQVI